MEPFYHLYGGNHTILVSAFRTSHGVPSQSSTVTSLKEKVRFLFELCIGAMWPGFQLLKYFKRTPFS